MNLVRQLMLEGSDNPTSASANKVLALFHDVGWHDIVVMQSWHFNLHSLDAIATDKADLIVLLSLVVRLAKLQPDEPLDLRLHVWVRGIDVHIRNVEAAQAVTRTISACVDPLNLFECDVPFGVFFDQRSVIAGSLHRMRYVAGVSKLVADTHRVEESDGLVSGRTHKQLHLLEVADVDNRSIVSFETHVDWHVPRRVRLEEFYHISLDVPNNDL